MFMKIININFSVTSWRSQESWRSCASLAIVVALFALVSPTTYGAIEYGTDNRSIGARYQLLPLSAERISEGTDYKFIPNQIDAYTQASVSVYAVDWAHQDPWGPRSVSAYAEAKQQSYYNPSELYFSGFAFLVLHC